MVLLRSLTVFMCRCSGCCSGGSGCCCVGPVLEQCDDQTTEQASALGTQHGTTTCNSLMVVPWILRGKHLAHSMAQQPSKYWWLCHEYYEESTGHTACHNNLQQFDGCAMNIKRKALDAQHGTTTCNSSMVVPWILRGKHWAHSMSQQPATVWWLYHEH